MLININFVKFTDNCTKTTDYVDKYSVCIHCIVHMKTAHFTLWVTSYRYTTLPVLLQSLPRHSLSSASIKEVAKPLTDYIR